MFDKLNLPSQPHPVFSPAIEEIAAMTVNPLIADIVVRLLLTGNVKPDNVFSAVTVAGEVIAKGGEGDALAKSITKALVDEALIAEASVIDAYGVVNSAVKGIDVKFVEYPDFVEPVEAAPLPEAKPAKKSGKKHAVASKGEPEAAGGSNPPEDFDLAKVYPLVSFIGQHAALAVKKFNPEAYAQYRAMKYGDAVEGSDPDMNQRARAYAFLIAEFAKMVEKSAS